MYLDFWMGGLGLALVAVGYHLTMGKTFGFSGIWEKVLYRRETDSLAAAERFIADKAVFLGATPDASREDDKPDAYAAGVDSRQVDSRQVDSRQEETAIDPDGWLGNLLFVAGVFGGGLIAALTTGGFQWRLSLGQTHEALFGDGVAMAIVLLIGGVLVGFGTRMAGGCTSGHGLNGCGQLQLPSMLATSVFFGTGIAVSWLLRVAL